MNERLTQVQPTPGPSGHGDAVAVVGVPIDEFAARHGLPRFDGADNLARYRAAAVRLPSGRRIGLLRHDGAPDRGTEIHADSADDPQEVVRELVRAAGIARSSVTWIRDGALVPEQEPASSSAS